MRCSGVLLPISFLPSAQGRGSLGPKAYEFIDFLSDAGQSLWQISAMSAEQTHYKRKASVFAGSLDWIDVGFLGEEGLLTPEEVEEACSLLRPFSRKYHLKTLLKATARQNKLAPDYVRFKEDNKVWLYDYALFMAIREAQGGKVLSEWPKALQARNSYALKTAQARLGPRIEFWSCAQFLFYTQWQALKKYAEAKGVYLVADMPFFVAADSVEAWTHPELFRQNIENDEVLLYNWPQHKRTRFDWWLKRFELASQRVSIIRMHHFSAFAGAYITEGQDTEALVWKAGPGSDLVRALHRSLPELKLITEDGISLHEDASALLAYSGYPGAKYMMQAFSSPKEKESLPHHYCRHMVLYTSFSEAESLARWKQSAKDGETLFARRYFDVAEDEALRSAVLRAVQASVADTVIVSLWDWFSAENTPETGLGFTVDKDKLNHWLCAEMREMSTLYERIAPKERPQKNKKRKSIVSFIQKGSGKEDG